MSEEHPACHIVVVDDETVVVSLVRDALEEDGFNVETFSNSFHALDYLKANQVELLLTDIRMPGLTGIDLVKQAREVNPDLAVVFMTGYATLNSAKDAIKQGASDYIMKPFELVEIRQAVNQAIARKQDVESRSSDQELSKLSSFGNMLFASADQEGVVVSTLQFAVMNLSARFGAIVIADKTEATLLSVAAEQSSVDRYPLSADQINMALDSCRERLQRESVMICPPSEIESHLFGGPESSAGIPRWIHNSQSLVVAPVMGGTRCLGLLILSFGEESVKLKKTDNSFLSIASRQLGMTLDNLFLLRETQQAYARLNELQEDTISLEKMATRGEMSAEIGHELNNFLGVIAGNVSLVEMYIKKEKYQDIEKHVIKINQTIERMTRFTANLMDLSSISSKREELDLTKMLQEVVEYLKPQKRFRLVSIDLQVPNSEAIINADTTQLQQLLYNLFNNSADAMNATSERNLSISLEISNESNEAILAITDTGVGFPEELVAKAFSEKFTTKPNGHGYGLVVCRRIIENHEGKLNIRSTPGVGTCITITFPLFVAEKELVTA